jgi:hypothetical protein
LPVPEVKKDVRRITESRKDGKGKLAALFEKKRGGNNCNR